MQLNKAHELTVLRSAFAHYMQHSWRQMRVISSSGVVGKEYDLHNVWPKSGA